MGDTKIVYDEKFGIATFKREICAEGSIYGKKTGR